MTVPCRAENGADDEKKCRGVAQDMGGLMRLRTWWQRRRGAADVSPHGCDLHPTCTTYCHGRIHAVLLETSPGDPTALFAAFAATLGARVIRYRRAAVSAAEIHDTWESTHTFDMATGWITPYDEEEAPAVLWVVCIERPPGEHETS